jgi:pimeloyl-ACP methyl ester carboxylesterase
MSWKPLEQAVKRVNTTLASPAAHQRFFYKHSQKGKLVPISYFEWGDRANPTVICMGGVANSAMRFSLLAKALKSRFHVVSMDWAGRGDSGWLEELSDYTNEQAVDQLDQLLRSLRKKRIHLIGSSYGGTIAITYGSRFPERVRSIVLNDIGPEMSASRRKRRSAVLAKHYVFHEFSSLERKVGASQKNDGINDKDLLLFNAFHLTRWSEIEQGRVYKHDPRAMLAYRHYASKKLNQWQEWEKITQPIFLVRGVLSDALSDKTVKRMLVKPNVSLFKVPNAGHTPSLMSPDQITAVKTFLNGLPK